MPAAENSKPQGIDTIIETPAQGAVGSVANRSALQRTKALCS